MSHAPRGMSSKYADVLNALSDMQEAFVYAARKPFLQEAERIIVALEQENDALQHQAREVGEACKQHLEMLERATTTLVEKRFDENNPVIKELQRQLAQAHAENETLKVELHEARQLATANNLRHTKERP